ncbi:helix-hairpin-helix domain-containing protein [Candidimonas humi]|nr:helix-hairpin-helix domain-containing protein [Candidimonas humi]
MMEAMKALVFMPIPSPGDPMNPFTESTVARPLGASDLAPARGVAGRGRRPFWRPALNALGLAAGLMLASAAQAVDVNVATQAQLESVRGIGPKTAQVILEERARGGRFESFEDLAERVKGIGPKKAVTLQASGLTVGAGVASAAAAGSAAAPSRPASATAAAKPVAGHKTTAKTSSRPGKQAAR